MFLGLPVSDFGFGFVCLILNLGILAFSGFGFELFLVLLFWVVVFRLVRDGFGCFDISAGFLVQFAGVWIIWWFLFPICLGWSFLLGLGLELVWLGVWVIFCVWVVTDEFWVFVVLCFGVSAIWVFDALISLLGCCWGWVVLSTVWFGFD